MHAWQNDWADNLIIHLEENAEKAAKHREI